MICMYMCKILYVCICARYYDMYVYVQDIMIYVCARYHDMYVNVQDIMIYMYVCKI